ncbi:MAG: hypothetical protein JWR07_1911 [Nevskia sp.]|nr:hypothetical protein [Nevskia sp.]
MPINDSEPNGTASLTAPSGKFIAVTPSDATVFGNVPRALWVGGAGAVAAVAADDSTNTVVTFGAIPAGTVLPIRPKQVMAATTATLIIALY